jgi:tRNA-specific 2-thiouridylase
METDKKSTVVVGMSGGVDSSLTAALLIEQGYAVIGVYMKNWSEPIAGVEHCPWVKDQFDARQVAHQLGIPFFTVNFEELYKKQVIDSFFADYSRGRTPNPDVLCNKFIKFEAFYSYARSLGADFIATGHYAQVKDGQILKGLDTNKDQTYFLWAIDKQVLPRILFPLGGMNKSEVRKQAEARGLATAKKRDSQGICFIGQADVHDFIAQELKPKEGNIISSTGEILGTHTGAWFYTLGQRHGLQNLNWPDSCHRPPLYVIATDIRANTVTVGEEKALYNNTLKAESPSWLGDEPKADAKLQAKIRYGQTPAECAIVETSADGLTVRFDQPQRAITPGQSLVLYDGDRLVGGAIIT